jgi:hypothetical protein
VDLVSSVSPQDPEKLKAKKEKEKERLKEEAKKKQIEEKQVCHKSKHYFSQSLIEKEGRKG